MKNELVEYFRLTAASELFSDDIDPLQSWYSARKKFPNRIRQRKRKRLRRKRFWSAGVMDIITFNQHDKWKRFGLRLYVGLDPFPGGIAWLKIWWINRNSKLITTYFLEVCRSVGGIPLITQSDLGSENNGIANCHTVTRQRLDPSLNGTLQHRWTSKTGMSSRRHAGLSCGATGLLVLWTVV
ncbi:hypothetical protein B0H10DRAFT_1964050 [Mycena sp. CBHHK59/15]|nr:hypothetical protein B0H10DRAFT_1964050 [Mycena sp. CBHHK59/15]